MARVLFHDEDAVVPHSNIAHTHRVRASRTFRAFFVIVVSPSESFIAIQKYPSPPGSGHRSKKDIDKTRELLNYFKEKRPKSQVNHRYKTWPPGRGLTRLRESGSGAPAGGAS